MSVRAEYKIVTGFVDTDSFVKDLNAAANEGFDYKEAITFPPNKIVHVVMSRFVWDEVVDAAEQKSE